MFANLSIRLKLFVSLLFITLLFAATGFVTMVQMRNINSRLDRALNHLTQAAVLTGYVRDGVDEYISYVMEYLLTTDSFDDTALDESKQLVSASFEQLDVMEEVAADARIEIEEAKIQYDAFDSDMASVIQLRRGGNTEEAIAVFNATANNRHALIDRVDSIISLARERRDAEEEALFHLVRRTQIIVTAMVVVGVIISLLVVVVLPSTISRPVVAVAKAARRLAQGDLTAEVIDVRTQDEVGNMANAFATAVENTRDIIQRVQHASDELQKSSEEMAGTSEETAAATEQIADVIQQVAAGTSNQSSSIEGTARALEQLQEAIEQIAQDANEQAIEVKKATDIVRQTSADVDNLLGNTERVIQAAAETQQVARQGGEVVEQTVHGMRRIYDSQSATATKMEELGAHSGEIGEIVAVISDIADQTNLLALNAAIEAARAGQHGQGFAVVAEEVRKLAERSASSAEEITQLIDSMQIGTDEAIEAMVQSTNEIENGMELANQAGSALDNILTTFEELHSEIQIISQTASSFGENSRTLTETIERVASITEANAAGSEEMASQSENVGASIENISAISEQTAASAQEVSASTEEASAASEEMAQSAQSLASIADELGTLVAQFRV